MRKRARYKSRNFLINQARCRGVERWSLGEDSLVLARLESRNLASRDNAQSNRWCRGERERHIAISRLVFLLANDFLFFMVVIPSKYTIFPGNNVTRPLELLLLSLSLFPDIGWNCTLPFDILSKRFYYFEKLKRECLVRSYRVLLNCVNEWVFRSPLLEEIRINKF